jgi:hypothetical protein
VLAPNQQSIESGMASDARHHGDFDDDPHTVASTFAYILGAAAKGAEPSVIQFRSSGSSLRDKRMGMDARTAMDGGR